MSSKNKNRKIQIFLLVLLFLLFLGVVIFKKIFNSNYTNFSTNENVDYNALFDNTWVINLDIDIDRWNTTNNRLKRINITPKRWKAIDAKMENVKYMYENHKKSNLLNKLLYKTPNNNFFRNSIDFCNSRLNANIACVFGAVIATRLLRLSVNNRNGVFTKILVYVLRRRRADVTKSIGARRCDWDSCLD